jgi:hypothetical protein
MEKNNARWFSLISPLPGGATQSAFHEDERAYQLFHRAKPIYLPIL